jgi:hypothetical protein
MSDSPVQSGTDVGRPPRQPTALRVEAWAGEARVNLIRIVAVVAFYLRHLVQLRFDPATAGGHYHTVVTAITIAWVVVIAVVHVLLVRRVAAEWIKYAALGADLILVTTIGMAAANPRSSLLALYFVVIATAPLRMSLGLVWTATLGAWAGYAAVLMWFAWHVIGWERYYSTPGLRVPRAEEAAWLLAMGVAGLLAGQVVRQGRRLAGGYPVEFASDQEGD